MAPIFASPDIAALVAAFPPPQPTKDHPSLVRSSSGTNLLDSRKVLANFRLLLENGTRRMRRADLLSELGIQDLDWVLKCYDGAVCWSGDLGKVVPEAEVRGLVERVRRRVDGEFVGVERLVGELDVAGQSFDRILAGMDGLRRFGVGEGREVVGSLAHVERTKEDILSSVRDSAGDRVDLSSARPQIPSPILLELSQEVLEQRGDSGSAVDENGRVVYIPSNYQSLQESKRKELYESQIAALCNDLATDGFCEMGGGPADLASSPSKEADTAHAMAQDVQAAFASKHGETELTTFGQHAQKTPSRSLILVKQSVLDETMTELQQIITSDTKKAQEAANLTVSRERLDTWLCDETSHLSLTQRLLRSGEHRRSLEDTLQVVASTANDAERQTFVSKLRGSLLCPLELYRHGLETIADVTLRLKLDQYICEHFRQDVVPNLSKSLNDAAAVQDKARSKDVEKLNAACSQANTMDDIHSACVKFCRKQKIALPDSDQLVKARFEILDEKLKSMQNMSRGSDVLQNLIWVVLAQASGGLFMSAGKDTSRMIKQYQTVGDAENGRKLEEWRDLLKAGKQSDSDVLEMKAMATQTVEGMYGGQRKETDR